MAIPSDILSREYQKFVETDGGNTAVRVVGSSGSTQLDVNNASNDVSGFVGKASGTNADFTTAYTSATTITLSNFPTGISAFVADDIVSVEQYATGGTQTARYTRDDAAFSMSGAVLTVAGATFTNTDTFVVYTNVRAPGESNDLSTAGSGNNNYSNMANDFTATITNGAKTVTVAGLPFTLEAKHVVAGISKVIDSSGNVKTISLDNVTVSSGVITYSDKSENFSTGDVMVLTLVGPDKTYDSSLDVSKTIDQSPLWARYTDSEAIISAAQDFTAAWADLGPEIDMRGYTELNVYITLDVNDSTDLQVKALGKHESGGSEEYDFQIETVSASDVKVEPQYIEFNTDADQLAILKVKTNGVPFIQLQVKAGTLGDGTDGQVDACYVNKVWR